MKVFVSNKPSVLMSALHDQLLSKVLSPFEKRSLIVPSEDVKSDLYLRWLEHTDIVTGIKTITYGELVRKMFPEIPSKMELALRLEAALEKSQKLDAYLKGGEHVRKLDLCNELSSLFLNYLKRPREELEKWSWQEGWQQELWKAVFGEICPTEIVKPLPGKFFFYHTPQIAPHEWSAFAHMDTAWFLLSPSEMYLGDFQTEWQQRQLFKKVRKNVKDNLSDYFQHDSPLLSNWGKQGRELLHFFENADTIELFHPPQKQTALHSLQSEWLTLEKQSSPADASIQLHSAPTLLREVEVVWEIIQKLPFVPRDIIVMAPQIQTYAAAIEWVFEQRGGPFDYAITGLEAGRNSHLLQGLEILLSLPKHRFSKEIFEKLLLCPPFLQRFNLSLEEAEMISKWMAEVRLRYDIHHLPGSWHESLKRMISSLASSNADFALDFSDASLMSRWIEMTLHLETSLSPLTDQKKRTGEEWASLIGGWLKVFFISEEEVDILNSTMATLRHDRVEGLFPYATIEALLQSALTKPAGSVHRSHLQSVRFTSLIPGAFPTAKAIICMGMQEGSFPRFDPPSSLPLLPIPHTIDEDQQLFLDTLSHAEEIVIFTYVRCHPDDGKEVHPSTLIQQLIKDRDAVTTTHHPLSSIDPLYYQASGFHSSSQNHYELLQIKKTSRPPPAEPLKTSLKKTTDVKLLKKLARHPLQFYLEEGLGLRFPWKNSDSEFLFSPVEMSRLRTLSLTQSTGDIIDQLLKEGKLPCGSFQPAALHSIEQELDLYQATIQQLGVDPTSLFSLELSPYCKTPSQTSSDRFVAPSPLITLSSGEVTQLQGIIPHLTPDGLLYHGDDTLADLLKIWPHFCLMQATLGITSLLLTKKGVIKKIALNDPQKSLQHYVHYLQKSLQTPSPLLPHWGHRLVKGDDLPKEIDDDIFLWAGSRALIPPRESWVAEWRPYLQEIVHELL